MYRIAEFVKHLNHVAQNWLRGKPNWGKPGVAISQMGNLPATIYNGDIYDCNACAIIPTDEHIIPALWEFCSSEQFNIEVRKLDKSLKVTPKGLIKIPFDINYWNSVAAKKYPNGLPEPYSGDPTQWLFHGHPAAADIGTALHVALARLAGYCWPAEYSLKMHLSVEARNWITKSALLPSAGDGILCIPAVAGERPLADRLRNYLAVAFGADWSEGKERQSDRRSRRTVRQEGRQRPIPGRMASGPRIPPAL